MSHMPGVPTTTSREPKTAGASRPHPDTTGRKTRVALAGFGTVGQSVARVLGETAPDVQLVAICNRDVGRKRAGWSGPDLLWTESIDEALAQDVDVFVELIGGRDPAEQWIRQALDAGISVVTANKQVIAHAGPSLRAAAAAAGCHLRFEAAVAGGVPIIGAIESGLSGDRLTRVAGILNGTCNYILTRMEAGGIAFEDALREAQSLGFAEADPTADVDGFDAQAKIAILCDRRTGHPSAGVGDFVPVDHARRRRGFPVCAAPRLHDPPGRVGRDGRGGPADGIGRSVARPARTRRSRVRRAAKTSSPCADSSAEKPPTAAAARVASLPPLRSCRTCWRLPDPSNRRVRPLACRDASPSSEFVAPFYTRFTVADRPGIIAALATVFARHGINIDAVLQESGFPAAARPFVMSLESTASSLR